MKYLTEGQRDLFLYFIYIKLKRVIFRSCFLNAISHYTKQNKTVGFFEEMTHSESGAENVQDEPRTSCLTQ